MSGRPSRRIGIVGPPDDPVGVRVEASARARGAAVWWISFDEIGGGAPIAFDGDDWTYKGERLADVNGLLVRQIPMPGSPPFEDPKERLTALDWWRRGLFDLELSAAARSAIDLLERRGARIANPPIASEPFSRKPAQLAAFREAGLPIPRTCVTNSPELVRRFARGVEEAVA